MESDLPNENYELEEEEEEEEEEEYEREYTTIGNAIDGQTIGQIQNIVSERNSEEPSSSSSGPRQVIVPYPYKPVLDRTPWQSIVIVIPASAYGMPDIGAFRVGDVSTQAAGSLAAIRLLSFMWRTMYEVQRGLGKMEPPRGNAGGGGRGRGGRDRGGRGGGGRGRGRRARGSEEEEGEDASDAGEDGELDYESIVAFSLALNQQAPQTQPQPGSTDPRRGDLFDHHPSETSFTCEYRAADGTSTGFPNFVVVREALYNRNGTVAAMRFSFENYNSNIDMNKAISQRILRFGRQQAACTARNPYIANNTDASVSGQITSIESWAKTLVDYFGRSTYGKELAENMNSITSPAGGMGILNDANLGCPTTALTFQHTAQIVERTVIQEQLTLAKYGMTGCPVFNYQNPVAPYATFGMPLNEPVETFYSSVYEIPRQMRVWRETLLEECGPNEPFTICVAESVQADVETRIEEAMCSEFAQPNPLTLASGSKFLSERERLANSSFIERRRQTYLPQRTAIAKLKPARWEDPNLHEVRERTEKYNQAQRRFAADSIKQVWEEDFCNPSNLIASSSKAFIAAMNHVANMNEADFPDFPSVASNLGTSDNLILSFFTRMVQAFNIKAGATGRDILMMWLGSLAVGCHIPGRCAANTTNFDGPEAGKSFRLGCMSMMLLPESIKIGSVMTPKALTAEGSLDGCTIIFHEAGPQHFGLGPDGRPSMKDDDGLVKILKEALTEGKINLISVKLEEGGGRTEIEITKSVRAAFHFASNTMPRIDPATPVAMLSRCMRIWAGGVHSVTDPDEKISTSVPTSEEQTDSSRDDFLRETRTIHALVLLTCVLIEMGVLPRPNTDIGIRLMRSMSDYAVDNGYEALNPRKMEQIDSLFTGLVLQLAVMKVIASELSMDYRPDANGRNRPIGPWFFEKVRDFLVLDVEMAVFVLTLVTEMVMPDLPSNVLKRIASLINDKDISTAPMTITQGQRVTIDNRYHIIEIPKSKLAALVAKGMHGVTTTAVVDTLHQLMNRTVSGSGSYLTETKDAMGMTVNKDYPHDQWIARVLMHVGSPTDGHGSAVGRARGDRFAICKQALSHHSKNSSRTLMEQFFTKTLSHAFARPRAVLTAFPLISDADRELTVNVLAPFEIKNDPANISMFQAGFRPNVCDQLLGQSRLRRPKPVETLGLNVAVAAADLDEHAVESYHISIGNSKEHAENFFPEALAARVRALWAEKAELFESAGLQLLKYPEEYLNMRKKEIELRNLVRPEAASRDLVRAIAGNREFNQCVISRQDAPSPTYLSHSHAQMMQSRKRKRVENESSPPVNIREKPMEMLEKKIQSLSRLIRATTPSPMVEPVEASPATTPFADGVVIPNATIERDEPPRKKHTAGLHMFVEGLRNGNLQQKGKKTGHVTKNPITFR
ncbi:MAG: hypothetical protein AB7P49_03695 [Bdellovibrionales bacterium]